MCHPKKVSSIKRKRISEYIVDETLLKVGSELIWLWVAIETENRQILALNISKERNMFVAERFGIKVIFLDVRFHIGYGLQNNLILGI